VKDKTKHVIIVIGFILIIFLTFIVNIIKEDKYISKTEKRRLSQFPKITFIELINGNFANKLEKYVSDQFIGRDLFRKIKSYFSINILRQKDSDDLFIKDNAIYKMEYPLKEKNIESSAKKISEVYEKHLKGMNVYYSIIPDKNYYLENDDHLKIKYDECTKIIKKNLQNLKFIDITQNLELDDYYRTDLHWKQENLQQIVSKIQKEMNLENNYNVMYNKMEIGDFYGTYYGQLGIDIKPDKMYILTNNTIDNCITYNYESNIKGKIYSSNYTNDTYDIFLSGAVPIINIENKNSNSEKDLILFRDSFGSSIAPLLVENYKNIILIDLRYMSSKLLEKYINFKNQDVLFLYSITVLNQNILK